MAHPPWRQLLIIAVAMPMIIALAVLAFAWPAANIEPRDVPIGVVGTGAVSQSAIAGVEQAQPGAFEPKLYVDEAADRAAITGRAVYGALIISRHGISVLTASAASPSVAALLTSLGRQIGQKVAAAAPSGAAGLIALIGSPGLGLGAALLVFVGNPFSGSTSAPELMPEAVDRIGQWLSPGAGASLVRSTAFFDGNGAAARLAALLAWSAFGLIAVVVGHHGFVGYAARRRRAEAGLRPVSVDDQPISVG